MKNSETYSLCQLSSNNEYVLALFSVTKAIHNYRISLRVFKFFFAT